MDKKPSVVNKAFFFLPSLSIFIFSSGAFSAPTYNLESCSKIIGTASENCYQDDSANGWAHTSDGPLNGWTSSDIQGWHANEKVAYRFDMSLPAAEDATNYYVRVEQDNLESGVVGIDGGEGFYVGTTSGTTAGTMTKHCTTIAGGNSLPSLPYQGDECVVAGPTFTGVDDDGDGRVDEDPVNGIDDDGDGKIDEDPAPDCDAQAGVQRIQYTVKVHFDSGEAGSSSDNWGLHWLSHLSGGSDSFPGGSVHTSVHSHREGDSDNQCNVSSIPVPPAPPEICNGGVATIVGTDLADTIRGTAGDDIIFGLGGDDVLKGQAGNDTICGDDGNDTLYGDDGDDILDGGLGDDHFRGGTGNDQEFGGDGDDVMYGEDGDDVLSGGAGADRLYGDAGNDQAFGGDGNDIIYGLDGDDILSGDAGDDRLYGGPGIDQIFGGDGNDIVYGQDGDDVLSGDAGDDRLYGDNGNDTLDGGNGTADVCSGGNNVDTAVNCESTSMVP